MEDMKSEATQNFLGGHFIDVAHANTEQQSTPPRKRRKMTPREKMENIASLLDEALDEAQCSFAHMDHESISEDTKEDLKPLKKSEKPTVDSKVPAPLEPRNLCRKVDCELREDHPKHSHPVDLTNPKFQVPLNCGWKRELVLRLDGKHSDVYYYPPIFKEMNVKQFQKSQDEGQNEKDDENQAAKRVWIRNGVEWGPKCRSYVDVTKFLAKSGTSHHLTVDNFTFTRRLLGCNDPNKEYVRHAVDKFERKKIREKLKSESCKTPSPKSPSLDSKMTVMGKASDGRFDEDSLSVKSELAQKIAESTLRLKNMKKILKNDPSINNEAYADPRDISTEGTKSSNMPTPSEPSLPTSQQNPIFTEGSQNGTPDNPQPRLSDSSKHLRPRVQQPLYDERLMMNKFRHRTVIESSRRKSRPGRPSKGFKHQGKRSSASKMPITTPIKKLNASTTTRPSHPILANFQSNSTPSDVDLLGFSDPRTFFEVQKRPVQGSQLGSSRAVEQTIESQGQISSKLNLFNGNLNNTVDEIKIEPELYVLNEMVHPKIETVQGRESIHVNGVCAADDHQFKVFMKEENAIDDKVEIRRFSIKFDSSPIYTQLREMLQTIFPNLKNQSFTLEWKDSEDDRIAVSSCVELKEALKVMRNYKVMKFYIAVRSSHVLQDSNPTA